MTSKKIITGLLLLFILEYLLLCLVAQTSQEDYFVLPYQQKIFDPKLAQQKLQTSSVAEGFTSIQVDTELLDESTPLTIELETIYSKYNIRIEPSNESLAIKSLKSSNMPFLQGGVYILSNKKESENQLLKETIDKIVTQ
jgi:hypothetical protein